MLTFSPLEINMYECHLPSKGTKLFCSLGIPLGFFQDFIHCHSKVMINK